MYYKFSERFDEILERLDRLVVEVGDILEEVKKIRRKIEIDLATAK